MNNHEIDRAIAKKFLSWHQENMGTELPPKPHWVWVSESGKKQYPVNLFEPSSDPAYCALVLDEIERRGWVWKWVSHSAAWSYSYDFRIYDGIRAFVASSDNRYRAVCEAALQAAEAERE
jgi:hypothetical protein